MPTSLDESRSALIAAAAALSQPGDPHGERAGSADAEPGGPGGERGAGLRRFLELYYRHVPTEDLLAREPADLLGMAMAHRELAAQRADGRANVAVVNPTLESEGWTCGHTVVQVVTDDMPFLVDSVTSAINRRGRRIHLIVHPQLIVRRDAAGTLDEVLDQDTASMHDYGELGESWISLEVDLVSDPKERAEIEATLRRVLANVRDAVEDWPMMREHCRELADALVAEPPVGLPATEVEQSVRFLKWLADDHFTFLGYREYRLEHDPSATPPDAAGAGGGQLGQGADIVTALPGTGLGLLRYDPPAAHVSTLTQEASRQARVPELLILTKANALSTVHRPTPLDYIGIRTFDEHGTVTGERRFLGLFAHSAYTESVRNIPLVADKAVAVLRRAGFHPESHSGKDLMLVLESYPRDELFQTGVDELFETTTAVTRLQERMRTSIFLRPDPYGRFMSVLVYLPRDRYTTAVRLKISAILASAFHGASIDYTTRVTESALAQLHFVARMPKGTRLPQVDRPALEREIIDATRTWDEDFDTASRAEHGEEGGARLIGLYGRAFPEAYKEDFDPRVGASDLRHLDRLSGPEDVEITMYAEPGAPATERRFKLFRQGALSLTDVLPVFTDLGVDVIDERPYELHRSDGTTQHIYDFGLRASTAEVWGSGAGRDAVRTRLHEAFAAVWGGAAESDGFNALVLRGGLTWREVVIVRAVAKYLRQTGTSFSQDYLQAALTTNPDLARLLVELFATRLDPSRHDDSEAGREQRQAAQDAVVEQIFDGLTQVTSLDQDRIIRAMLGVVRAILRTNYYQPDDDGQPKDYVAIKLDPAQVPELPAPRPMFEIWVYSPRVEGVHLRFGKVARGGLRWSDRREDFRTEILGLVKAQMVKNAVIVPTGSKGGFFPKALPDPLADRDAWLAEGQSAYQVFISGLLDLTDNLVGGEVVAPRDVVRHDADDSYLVVAADKGTATFSDLANAKAQAYGYWLDDAFASGGSAGYDHKEMGITAKGAWESVKRHFRELGHDTQTEDFTVVGVGDMSGDVFGNGMLLSEHIRLVAAFDHRHIFVDPEPDAATSFAERRRLFELPRSSWADYDSSLISTGGGVFARSAKSVPVSEQMVRSLGLPAGTTSTTPAELMRAILIAPVDLLWNGGIGTYVKASSESSAEVGDHANDAIRVDGKSLRCKVIGEGGNLGATQLGRIEAALAGVRVNTDAIDNSAGVDTSDHEVNIKILLTALTRDGDMTLKQRNSLLASMTDDVEAQVLRDNYEQNVLLGNARAQQHAMVTVHERLIHWLEGRGELDRSLEFLPSDAELARRHREGQGLTSPEFCVLVAYSKLASKADLLPTSLPDDPWFRRTLADYFPPAVREAYGDELASHPLRREIITNSVVNSMINRGGITFAYRVMEETGASAEEVARAYVVSREVFDLAGYVAAIEALDNVVPTGVQTRLYLEFRRLLDRSVRWFLTTRTGTLEVGAEIDRFRPVVGELGPQIPRELKGDERTRLEGNVRSFAEAGVPHELAEWAGRLLDEFSLLEVAELAESTGSPAADALAVYNTLSERFAIDRMLTRVTGLAREDRWDNLARGALRDDLYAVLTALTRAVLTSTDPADSPADRVQAWCAANSAVIDRAREQVAGIDRLERPGISAISVALRALRGVTRAAG